MGETIILNKKSFKGLLSDFEQLLSDFENLAEQSIDKEAIKRLSDMKSKKIKAYTEKDFYNYLKKEGINA